MSATFIDLNQLNGKNGFIANGIDPQDFSGRAVSNAGDINGDGFDDVIIGANNAGLRRIGLWTKRVRVRD